MKYYKDKVEILEPNQVFIFTSNLQGFHGAGSAGYATFNEVGNVWRQHNYDKWGRGTLGKWNIKGFSEGFQIGSIGKSYAIPTVTHAGAKRSRTLDEIKDSIKKFYEFAIQNPKYEFLVAQEDKMGLNGYTPEEMASCWKIVKIPENVIFEEKFYTKYIKN